MSGRAVPVVEAGVAEGEELVVEAEQVEDGGAEVVDATRFSTALWPIRRSCRSGSLAPPPD
jgi:hypothetical protein